MSTELHWPRRSQFSDRKRDFRFAGPGTTEVPDDAVEQYREKGWIDPPEETEAPAAVEQESEPDTDSEEDEAEADDGDSEEFDAEGFVDRSWQAVEAGIESGEADGHLEAVREAEESRDGGPRENSVIEAIEARQG